MSRRIPAVGTKGMAIASLETPERTHVRYDGELLQFRVLVGAADGGVVIDRRLLESIHIDSRTIHDCATGAEVWFWYADWFGRDVEFLLFPREKVPDAGPDCIDVQFAVRPEPVAHPKWEVPLVVHAERTNPDGRALLAPDSGFETADAGS